MTTDFSFDNRVAERYNRQRAHPPEVSAQIGQAIINQLGKRAHILEIGVGTGRIAFPVAGAGGHVVGFDISPEMLQYAAANQPTLDNGDLMLLRADMHHLPFSSATFDAVQAIHVLHLTQSVEQVLRESVAVLKADGAFVLGKDWVDPESVVGQLRNHLRHLALKHAKDLLPPSARISVPHVLKQLGGHDTTEVIAAEWMIEISPQERLDLVKQRLDEESWIIPDHLFDTIFDELHTFASEQWTDLTVRHPVTRRFLLTITRGQWHQ